MFNFTRQIHTQHWLESVSMSLIGKKIVYLLTAVFLLWDPQRVVKLTEPFINANI